MSSHKGPFATVVSQGGLFPPEFLARITPAGGKEAPEGLDPAAYHLPGSERLTEAVNRSWNTLRGRWEDFARRASELPADDRATGVTRDHWLRPLFRELGFGQLQPPRQKLEIEGREYPISHLWNEVPIHLLGFRIEIDRRTPGAAGAARMSPHAMLQEFLNRTPESLWGIVSNGYRLRLLRDNAALTRLAYIEFDLQGMFDGNHYPDFALLWLLCHQSRFEGERPELCWLEKWTQEARRQGVRLLDRLREGVQKSIEFLGTGFIAHPANQGLRDKLHSGDLNKDDYYRQVLRLVYRLIFLFVAEDRDLLLLRGEGAGVPRGRENSPIEAARTLYQRFYSTRRLRKLALRRAGSAHGDLWEMLGLVMRALGSETGCPELALPPLGSFLWSDEAMPDLAGIKLSNRHLLDAVRALASTKSQEERVRRIVDYQNLGSEELGSVYESLLELHPNINLSARSFTLDTAAGHERKTSGSYYTPDALVQCLLDSALDPVIAQAVKGKKGTEAEKAILALKVCDPAVGSGHFLIAAAHRLAKRLAAVRSGEDEPSPEATHTALRDVIGRCLYGVDINPMAAELCRVSLWLEALDPGKPLSFLDHHIRVGNSLLGATPEAISAGLPDDAFKPIEGDDRKVCSGLKKENKTERKGQRDLFQLMTRERPEDFSTVVSGLRGLDQAPDDTVAEIRRKADQYQQLTNSPEYRHRKRLADAWCAAFVWPKTPQTSASAILTDTLRRLETDPSALTPAQNQELGQLVRRYRFFHWHLAFPEVFERGGFDCALGNPPWERVKLQEQEWFAERNPEIANAPNAAVRKRMIEDLKADDPALHRSFLEDLRRAEGDSHLLRSSGHYPLCGRGDINLYTVFAEAIRGLVNEYGRAGCVLPSGIATDDTTKFFFQDVIGKKSLVSLFDFENRKGLFPDVDSRMKFCLFTVASGLRPAADKAEFVFFAHDVEELSDPDRRFTLSPEDIFLLNPNTKTCPIFRSRADAELTKAIYRRVPVLIREAQGDQPEENPWGIKFGTMFHMSNDSHLFRTREQLEAEGWNLEGNIFRKNDQEYLPLYEAKMLHHFDHRWATYDGLDTRELTLAEKQDPRHFVLGRYWVRNSEVRSSLANTGWSHRWLLGWRDITNTTNERTVVGGVFPISAVGNNLPVWTASSESIEAFASLLSSLACDFTARLKVGGTHLNFFIAEQISVLPPAAITQAGRWSVVGTTIRDWLKPRALELTYTAWDLKPFARDCGYDGPPFRWNEDRRFLLRCELDAAFFHLYLPADKSGDWQPARKAEGCPHDESPEQMAVLKEYFPTPRTAVGYVMDTFPIVKRKDEEKYGSYRTKDTILGIYDAMQDSIRTDRPYQTRLDPPPADPSLATPGRNPDANVEERG